MASPSSSGEWDKIKKYIEALPDNVCLTSENNVAIKEMDQDTAITIKEFCALWKLAGNTSAEFLKYLSKALSKLNEPDKVSVKSNLEKLSERLSVQMNKLHLKVVIEDSLADMLLAVINGKYNVANNPSSSPVAVPVGGGTHKLSVMICVPELDSKHVKQDRVSKALHKGKLIEGVDPKWYDEKNIEKFSVQLSLNETVFQGEVKDIQALVALAIVLKCYPEQWHHDFFWDAWLAVTIQLCLSHDDDITFPCIWMRQAFDVERLVNPGGVNCILLGKDPVSKTSSYGLDILCKATGIAFHAIKGNASINGMKTRYKLDCDDNKPVKYCKDGLFMVNMIRCIGENDESLTNNRFCSAWIAYTLKLVHYFSSKSVPVLAFATSTPALLQIYIPAVCTGVFIPVPHPSADTRAFNKHKENVSEVCQKLRGFHIR